MEKSLKKHSVRSFAFSALILPEQRKLITTISFFSLILSLIVLSVPNRGIADICSIGNDQNCVLAEQKLIMIDRNTHNGFGYSVAVAGNLAIIGAPSTDGGSAAIYQYNGEIWLKMQNLAASDGDADDAFGNSVDISGNYAIVGAFKDEDNGYNSGSAYIYHCNGNTWVEVQKLTADAIVGVTGYHFGTSVAISGNTAIIGRPYEYSGNPLLPGSVSLPGSAYIYKFNGSNWVFAQKLIGSDGDSFGFSVDILVDSAIVGAPGCIVDEWRLGAAYIYHFNGSTWVEMQKIIASDGAHGDEFGLSAAISGKHAIVGAWENGYLRKGSAYIYNYNGSTWIQEQKLTASDGAAEDYFGYSVAISGNHAIVGAHGDDDKGVDSGSAYIFNYDGSTWHQAPKLTASDGADEGDVALADKFGWSVAISENYAIAGAPGADVYVDFAGGYYDLGAGYLYTFVDGSDTDGDGYIFGVDCNDSDNTVHTLLVGYADSDGDGFTVRDPEQVCTNGTLPVGYLPPSASIDNNDADDTVYPNAPELCDGLDNNQDGILPATEIDNDSDGYVECAIDSGGWDGDPAVLGGNDSDDNNSNIYPGAPELCDGLDNNQNGWVDENPDCPFNKTFSDDFDDNELDPVMWNLETDGDIVETNGTLLISQPQSDAEVWEGVSSNCIFAGDFDVTVDFNLLDWPEENNSLSIRLIAHDDGSPIVMEVSRIEHWDPTISQSYYLVNFSGIFSLTPTSDLSGKLKMTRRGSTLTGYYYNGNNFVEIGSGIGSEGPVSFTLDIFSSIETTGGKVAFDNFNIINENIYCPDSEPGPYSYSVDYFHLDGNMAGSIVDDFDDGVLWEGVDGTAIESNGVVTLSDPGTIETELSDNYFETEQASAIYTSNSDFQIKDEEGNFTAESRWIEPLPALNHVINMTLELIDNSGEEIELFEVGIYNFGPLVADGFGIPEGMRVYFILEDDLTDTFLINDIPIGPEDITGDVIFGIHYDDDTNQFSASYNLDGGVTPAKSIGSPFDSKMSEARFAHWALAAEAMDIQQIFPQIIDNGYACTSYTGTWEVSESPDPFGENSMQSTEAGATYTFETLLSGYYEVSLWWTSGTQCINVPVNIYDGDQLLDTVNVNQQTGGGQWNLIGTYNFSGTARLEIVSAGTCLTSADAVKIESLMSAEKGDIDGDGDVDLADAMLALQVIVGIEPSTTIYKEADVNGDGKIGTAEAIYILQKVVGLRE